MEIQFEQNRYFNQLHRGEYLDNIGKTDYKGTSDYGYVSDYQKVIRSDEADLLGEDPNYNAEIENKISNDGKQEKKE